MSETQLGRWVRRGGGRLRVQTQFQSCEAVPALCRARGKPCLMKGSLGAVCVCWGRGVNGSRAGCEARGRDAGPSRPSRSPPLPPPSAPPAGAAPPAAARQHDVTPRAQRAGAALRLPARAAPRPPREQPGAAPTMPCGAARCAPPWRRPPPLAQPRRPPPPPPPPGPAAPEPRAPLALQHERRRRRRLLGTRPLRRLLRHLRAGHRDRAGAGRALR